MSLDAELGAAKAFGAGQVVVSVAELEEFRAVRAELSALVKREYRLVNDAAVQRRFVEQLRTRLDAHEAELDALTGKLEQARHERDRALARLEELGVCGG